MTNPTAILSEGDVVDRYEVKGLIGSGAMSQVYCVRHRALGTLHALKLLVSDAAQAGERLVEEGRIQARLRHPNLVAVTDLITVNGRPALIMEHVAGPTLAQMLLSMTLSVSESERLFRGIASGLAFAHSNGIVHRDLKPSNILIATDTSPPTPRICDFGVARFTHEERNARTATGVSMGTPLYMAPEQLSTPADVDQRADLFALGLILYEMVAGQHPFRAHPVPPLAAVMGRGSYQDPLVLVPELPEPLYIAIQRCLEPDPARRIASADALLDLLDPITAAPRATESTGPSEAIPGWTLAGSHPALYRVAVDRHGTHRGRACARIWAAPGSRSGFGTLLQGFRPQDFLGKRIQLSGWVRCEEVRDGCGVWMRVDDARGKTLSFDNMNDRPIKGTQDWTCIRVVLDVPEEAHMLVYGLMLHGASGTAWIDDLAFHVVDDDVPVTGGAHVAPAKPANLGFDG